MHIKIFKIRLLLERAVGAVRSLFCLNDIEREVSAVVYQQMAHKSPLDTHYEFNCLGRLEKTDCAREQT